MRHFNIIKANYRIFADGAFHSYIMSQSDWEGIKFKAVLRGDLRSPKPKTPFPIKDIADF
jgi:hypothetical protein